jgi:hypothetical protein
MLKTNPVGAKRRHSVAGLPKTEERSRTISNARPRWDALTRTLYFGDCIVKRFRRHSPNAELILQAFEEQGWPFRIDDPLPVWRGHSQKRRLHESIQNLNRRLGCRLLIFRGDGSGKGIRWEAA